MKKIGGSHSAISIVNGISTRKGAAIAISLYAKVYTEYNVSDYTIINFRTNQQANTLLIQKVVEKIVKINNWKGIHTNIFVDSQIPVSVGLKSSSAVAIALFRSFSYTKDDMLELVSMSNIEAGISITGAYDDAASCYYNGITVSDNENNVVIENIPCETWYVLICIPEYTIQKSNIDRNQYALHKEEFEEALSYLMSGEMIKAIEKNGIVMSKICNIDLSRIKKELEGTNALVVSISGTGPAVFILYKESTDMYRILLKMSKFYEKMIICKAGMLK
ncbi:MAG: shikimate kinase [Thermoplasmata archaeon]